MINYPLSDMYEERERELKEKLEELQHRSVDTSPNDEEEVPLLPSNASLDEVINKINVLINYVNKRITSGS